MSTEPDSGKDNENNADSADTLQLNSAEVRILGCLIEKQATNPETYPLTLNALVLACNQKTSREPVMNLTPGQVGQSLRALESQQLTRLVMGSRADRWEHRVDKTLELVPAQLILTGLLLLFPWLTELIAVHQLATILHAAGATLMIAVALGHRDHLHPAHANTPRASVMPNSSAATETTTDRPTYSAAWPRSPRSIRFTVSSEKVENVVKPPSMPVITSGLRWVSPRLAAATTKTPIRRDPRTFTVRIATGKLVCPTSRTTASPAR